MAIGSVTRGSRGGSRSGFFLAAGRSTSVAARAASASGTASNASRLRLIVISELPRTADTLLLRLLGAGATLRTAMAELIALPHDAWARTLLVPLFLKFRFKLPEDPSQRTPEEEAFIMTAEDYVEAIRDEGKKKGRSEGREELLAHQVERRLRRSLTEGERATLGARVKALGAEQVSDLASDLAPDALASWLADREAR
jgi:hypothetical protein